MLFQFFGGLGIFLFGLKYMGDGLQRTAGDNLRAILNSFTSTPFRAILAGIGVTVLIQSSSATTVLAVGLVSAGFMTLKQAIGVIMGANIGTTITAFIIGIDIGAYALPLMAIGSFLLFFSKKPIVNSFGQVIFGFGALFLGLELMGNGMSPLEELPQFRKLMLDLSYNPLLGVLTGTALTLVVQSSSATIGILQEMYAHGSVSLEAALPILFGSNIGTTITAILASIGASVAAKRASASHVIFNVSGTLLVLMLLQPFTAMMHSLAGYFQLNPEMQIAFAHGAFNVANVLIQMWFINQIADVVIRVVPGSDSLAGYETSHLDYSLIHTSPVMALNQAKMEIGQMGTVVTEQFRSLFSFYQNLDEKKQEQTLKLEEVVNDIDMKLTEYLMLISSEELPVSSAMEYNVMMDITKYLERIGDHSENIVKNIREANHLANRSKGKGWRTSGEDDKSFGDEDLLTMFELVEENITEAIESFTMNSYKLAGNVIRREKEINSLEMHLREKYISRLNQGIGQPSDGIMFVDIVSNLERISDHTVKIAKHALGFRYPFLSAKTASLGNKVDRVAIKESESLI